MRRTKFNAKVVPTVPVAVSIIPERKRTGPKGLYQDWMWEDAERLTGLMGARLVDLATYFGVDDKTIEYWMKTKPEFNRAVKRGRLHKCLNVANALYQKAVGVVLPETISFMHQATGKIVTKNVWKQYPPDAYAAKQFLSIMFREVWADNKIEVDHNFSGSVEHKHKQELPIDDLTKEQKELLFKLNFKQLSFQPINGQ